MYQAHHELPYGVHVCVPLVGGLLEFVLLCCLLGDIEYDIVLYFGYVYGWHTDLW